MSDQSGMSHDELISALRSDMAATAAERDAEAERAAAATSQRKLELQNRERAEAEVARLEKAAADASMPDAQIRAGLAAIRQRFFSLFRT